MANSQHKERSDFIYKILRFYRIYRHARNKNGSHRIDCVLMYYLHIPITGIKSRVAQKCKCNDDNVCVRAYIRIYVSTYIYICVCVCLSVYVCVGVRVCIYIDMSLCACARSRACGCVYIRTDTDTYTYIHTYIHTYVHTYIHT